MNSTNGRPFTGEGEGVRKDRWDQVKVEEKNSDLRCGETEEWAPSLEKAKLSIGCYTGPEGLPKGPLTHRQVSALHKLLLAFHRQPRERDQVSPAS